MNNTQKLFKQYSQDCNYRKFLVSIHTPKYWFYDSFKIKQEVKKEYNFLKALTTLIKNNGFEEGDIEVIFILSSDTVTSYYKDQYLNQFFILDKDSLSNNDTVVAFVDITGGEVVTVENILEPVL